MSVDISYGFAEATEQFANAGVTLHALTNFPEVLTAALEAGKLTEGDAAIVRDWLEDPYSWKGSKAVSS